MFADAFAAADDPEPGGFVEADAGAEGFLTGAEKNTT
jgi:hypothetical protein